MSSACTSERLRLCALEAYLADAQERIPANNVPVFCESLWEIKVFSCLIDSALGSDLRFVELTWPSPRATQKHQRGR